MTAAEAIQEVELAAYEMAKAETRERSAALYRLRATKRIAAVHAELRHWDKEFRLRKEDLDLS